MGISQIIHIFAILLVEWTTYL